MRSDWIQLVHKIRVIPGERRNLGDTPRKRTHAT